MLPDSITGQKALDDAEKMKRENQQKILAKIQEDHAQGKDVTKLIETLKNTLSFSIIFILNLLFIHFLYIQKSILLSKKLSNGS